MRLDKSDSVGKIGPRREFIKFGSVTTLCALTCGLSTTLAQQIADPHPAYRIYDVIVLGLGEGWSCPLVGSKKVVMDARKVWLLWKR